MCRASTIILVGLLASWPISGARADDYHISPAKRAHWAWQLVVRPPVPTVAHASWVRNPIDAFILSSLEARGIPPARPAVRESLIRRVTLDLTGLVPSPEEVDAFVRDASPDAWERVVDRLLGSPRYGERWGRHWLDLVRFAESNGYELDEIRPDAWRYRDYVIRSLNANKPYDRFLVEQLAGDEQRGDDPDALIATGYNLLGPDMTDTADQAQRRQNTLDDMTETTGLVFLGLTIGCARCHDHKFEPIPQSDFYRLEAFFAPSQFRRDLVVARAEERQVFEKAAQEYELKAKPLREALVQIEEPYRRRLREARLAKIADEARIAHQTPPAQRTAAQKELVETTERLLTVSAQQVLGALSSEDRQRHDQLEAILRAFDALKPRPLPLAMGLRDGPAPARTFLLERGELNHRGEEVLAGFPIVLSGSKQQPGSAHSPAPPKAPRLELARWIASPENPLTARVLVNRLWQHHFGRGIVRTASDFGVRGERPTHPELLDWLASEFTSSGWDMKHLHRLMLTSATYTQSCQASPEAQTQDPDNDLFSRMNRLRLEGESLRDNLLAVSGRLNDAMGGPGVLPPVPTEKIQGFHGWKASVDPRDHTRRSIYVFARRNLRFPFLEVFDLPDSNLSCPARQRSTTAPQALSMLNGSEVQAAADALADRLRHEASQPDRCIAAGYRYALGRAPSVRELALAQQFLASAPLREFCRALFNLNEFLYTD